MEYKMTEEQLKILRAIAYEYDVDSDELYAKYLQALESNFELDLHDIASDMEVEKLDMKLKKLEEEHEN